ncbi:MAG: hypothetical protein U0232_32380 [Thermomicrobiales bacterium]
MLPGPHETDVEVGLSIAAAVAGTMRITTRTLPGDLASATWHREAHGTLGQAYGRLPPRREAHRREAAGLG